MTAQLAEVSDWIACDIRKAAVANALACVDLRAADPNTHDALLALLGPPPRGGAWDLAHAYHYDAATGQTRGVSTCGLVAVGLLRRVIDLSMWDGPYREWPTPYRGLDVVSALSQLGITLGARRPAGEPSAPGDVICIRPGGPMTTHVLTVVARETGTLISVDGGQVDGSIEDWRGLQRTRLCRRVESALRVVWSLDIDRLAAALPRATWLVPVGADIALQ
jgi:hypothetical protein